MQNKAPNNYDSKSKEILKQIGIDKKPLAEQINKLKKKLDLDKRLKEKLAKVEDELSTLKG